MQVAVGVGRHNLVAVAQREQRARGAGVCQLLALVALLRLEGDPGDVVLL